MPTAFRTTATLSDCTGRFRTSLVLASRRAPGYSWSKEAIAEHVKRQPLPTRGVELTDSEWEALEADACQRTGYVDAPGDIDSPFQPEAWAELV